MPGRFTPGRLTVTSVLVASAFVGLFLVAHCIHHPGDDDHHQHHSQGRPCPICQVWSLPFVATPAVEFVSEFSDDVWGPATVGEAPAPVGVWLASPNRPPPSSLLSSC